MKLDRFIQKLEGDYAQEKAREAENLHNAVAHVIADHKAEIQTVLYVLELVKFEVLQEKYKQIFGQTTVPPGDTKPSPIKFGERKG